MKTIYWSVDKNVDKEESYSQIQQAADLLKKNEVVAFPTETVYGLGGNAKEDSAITKIFAAKGRPSDNPLIIHIAKRAQLNELVEKVPATAEKLMDAFWPGPLTIIFEKKQGMLSEIATAGLSTVGIRMPDHAVALRIIEESGLPIAAPSANRSGKPSPTKASHVKEDLDSYIAGIVDGGPTGVGVESTVVDCTEETVVILRPGGITKQQLESVVGEVRMDQALINKEIKPKSPGMKYTHYAPNAPLFLVDGSKEKIQLLVEEEKQKGHKVGILTTLENKDYYQADFIYACGKRADLSTVATELYDGLRSFDHKEIDIIFGEMFPAEGVGQAIMNRLMKAASHQVIK
ncbi:L-threonylcarbamoyladenylate synthase [Niallia sp. Sow4_A1]|jgi:L-threonylcarbamoyladenylate synthase|uniref:Threonylcarbamoyl-AMP synthase n=1 Tax=Niallia hominis TaxID=3133173 RepID=A0ABV1F0G5_9BACI|nr:MULTISPECIES: L-threonylcarbamoyladenylate synthase [Bacillaceae]MCF2649641.1 threonylcarbamoyl-AMP synthase [Niallia circulans]MCM3364104.1 L-threonylcarbamoyladenylate synthase [Niallia sp. MER TA 168]CAI9396460.1 Threonylcarbamoyl-AMP synthase [Bacillus sp. T2.9-1]